MDEKIFQNLWDSIMEFSGTKEEDLAKVLVKVVDRGTKENKREL